MPRAREEGLVIKALSDELLVYDLERHEAHCLNRAAALVWGRCDGRTTVSEVAALFGEESKGTATEEAVWLALDGLREAHLLRDGAGRNPEAARRVSRRTLIRTLGLAAAALPLVTSIVVPRAAAAQSVNCASFTTQASCGIPLKVCAGKQLTKDKKDFFCRWEKIRGQQFGCICSRKTVNPL